jgi:dTDP-6-deoxy-L-talose 4-dehydrogenase (NAD+)
MKITVTGATGFIGNYVVQELLQRNIEVVATGTSREKAQKWGWLDKVNFYELDVNKGVECQASIIEELVKSDKLIHLVWAGLPNYKDLFHFEEQLMPQYFFLKKMVELGLKDMTVTGTCFEYGMKNGALRPDMPSDPQNPYALAKDTLRKFLEQLQKKSPFALKWIRLFYMYGKGQSEKSILSQLEKALQNGEKAFNMSGGEQLRDYLPVEAVTRKIVDFSLKEGSCLQNCCSGVPISIRSLVENHLASNHQHIELNRGFYPYPDFEPMAFWGAE